MNCEFPDRIGLAPLQQKPRAGADGIRTDFNFQKDFVPADGTRAAIFLISGGFGTSPLYWQLSDKPMACLSSTHMPIATVGRNGPKKITGREGRA